MSEEEKTEYFKLVKNPDFEAAIINVIEAFLDYRNPSVGKEVYLYYITHVLCESLDKTTEILLRKLN